ncbi:5,6-dimethylbenzimidazole synthase [Methylotenera mobilis]|uniref:Cob(II)yrinic acid a,c-diamide reductase n=1 Tax=Methylotenera mobilis (strain JLW8 / ATCC BAA-1282 / DSM 17540) TaxID=583345 RepID=C6WSU1_METML|nr:5,6-dimethylbenzimidazole synthase [Methylotenera mobilis]ACT47183.1 cob(II)yrinic acid a,c-diamide reductase [Methylotenera mobilis JLW8]
MQDFSYPEHEKEAIYRVIAERRDMRHFLPDPVEPEVLAKILHAAHHAPSVGLMQPWRFIRITDVTTRKQIHQLVDQERMQTAQAIGDNENAARMAEFLRLKVEGILECGELIVVTLCDKREQHIFGRRTIPEMDIASVSCAIQNMWLTSRAEGLGMGWVSIFDPMTLGELLNMPAGAKPVAILCLGHVSSFYKEPMLVETGWKQAKPLADMVMENHWDNTK